MAGLELGADDYVVKPFSPASCWPGFGRCSAAAATRDEGESIIAVGDLSSTSRSAASVVAGVADRGRPRPSSTSWPRWPTSPGRVFTRSQLLETIHGVAVEAGERAIDAHVKNLRRKIEAEPHRPDGW